MPLLDHFGLFAPYYERVIKFTDPEKFINWLKLPVDGTILDAGGGTGRVSASLSGQARDIIVADLSTGMLRQASQKDGLQVVNSESEALPFPSNSFERVMMVDALHHVCNQAETAAELWRVVKPGGRILIEEPDVRTVSIKLVALAEKLALMRSHFLSPPKIKALFPEQDAYVEIVLDGYNAVILIDKPL